MPTSTDLVTDLPADFEVFGQAVDTDFIDLLGGTTGQVLSKTSATDLDFTWVTAQVGDITGVTAGNGISVTDPTGPVPTVAINTAVTADLTTAQTLTNKTLTSPALTTPTISTLTTNGDLLYGTGSGALARKAIGTTGQVLTVAAGIPSWETSSAPALVGVQATRTNVSTSLTGGTAAALLFPTENFDTDAFHSTATNTSRITIPTGKGGKYLVTLFANTVSVNPSYIILTLYLNGAQYTASGLREGTVFRNDGQIPIIAGTVVTLAAADYLEFYFQQSETATANMYFQFTAIYLGA